MIYLILFLLVSPQPGESAIFTIMATVFGFAYTAYEKINGAHDTYNKFKTQTTLDDVLSNMRNISERIGTLQKKLEAKIERAVELLLFQIPKMQQINDGLRELSDHMIDIDTLFEIFQRVTKEKNINNDTLVRMSERITGFASNDLQPTLDKISRLIHPRRTVTLRESILKTLAEITQETNVTTCGNGMGKSRLIFDIFSLLMTTEIRGWMMTSFAYLMLERFKGSGYMTELRIMQDRMLNRTKEYHNVFRERGAGPSLEIRSCTLPSYVKGVNLIEIFRFSNDNVIADGSPGRSAGRITLLPQIADIENNYVITGISFTSYGGAPVIQFSIQQGQIKAQGYVRKDTLRWHFPDMIISDDNTGFDNGEFMVENAKSGKKRNITEKDIGVFKKNQDIINIDTIIVPKDYVVTDTVRFNYRENDEFKPIQLEVYATPYDFLTGKLIISDEFPSIWVTPDDMKGVLPEYDRPRQLQQFEEVEDLDQIKGELEPNSKPNSFIQLQAIGKKYHLGRTVVPLVDMLENQADPPFALAGIGLEHRSIRPKNAGFLSTVLLMVDPLKYLQFDEAVAN